MRRMRGLLATMAATACALLMMTPQSAAAADPPLPFPPGNTCVSGTPRYETNYEYFEGVDDLPYKILPGQTLALTKTITKTFEASITAGSGLEIDAVVAKAKADVGVGAKASITHTGTATVTVTAKENQPLFAQYGVWKTMMYYSVPFSPAGCNAGFEHLPGWSSRVNASVPFALGWHTWNDVATGGGHGNPGSVTPPKPPQPQPVTDVRGLADGTVLATTDTKRIYKMVGGAPVWQSTCDDGICQPESRPTTQAVINAGPATPRNASSAIDQRGRVYIFAGGAPLWQSHCSAPVNCGTPVKVSNWSIDARDHMNQEPADGQLVQGAEPGSSSVTPVAATIGGARINFASPQEVIDTGHGTDWPGKVVIISTYSFNRLGEVPRDGTLIQGTGGGVSTPVAMFAGGARINFGSPEEVVETGYGADWRSKVRAIPKRVFDNMLANIPPDRTLVQGISNGVPTPVAQIIGGTRINFASPQEVIDAGYGTDWASKVRIIPARAFNIITADRPVDGTLVQGAGGADTPVAQIVGGARINFASPQEVIDAGYGTDWASKVHAIPARAFHQLNTRIADGTRLNQAGSPTQAGVIGGARIDFASPAELEAAGFDTRPMWVLPDRVWSAMSTRIADG
ncbi:hypothetical protein ACH4TV_46300, partial [Streptomyces sp. NPDC020898]|uniref:hypothetical protein n=1 Tax=Streptomyces sp. NPDC020898 TaxID=3365101 RepID=UPI0037AAD8B0